MNTDSHKTPWPHIFKDDEQYIPHRHPEIFVATLVELFTNRDPQKYQGSILEQAIALPLEETPFGWLAARNNASLF